MTDTQKYTVQLEAPPVLMHPGSFGTVNASLVSANTSITRVSANDKSVTDIQFDLPVGKHNVLGTDIRISMRPRFLVKTAAAAGGADYSLATARTALGGLADIAFSPFSILNLVNSMNINFGSNTYTITNPGAMMQLLATATNPYVASKTLSNCCIRPDFINDYRQALDTVKDIKVCLKNGNVGYVKYNQPLQASGLSGWGEADEWGYRTPAYYIELNPGSPKDSFYITFEIDTFIPMSLFGVSKNATPLWGIEKMHLTMNLKTEWSRLFSIKNSADSKKFDLQTMEFVDAPTLSACVYTPPQDIISQFIKPDGNIMPYDVPFNHFQLQENIITQEVDAGKEYDFIFNSIAFTTLPKRLYVGVIRNLDTELVPETPFEADTPAWHKKAAKPRTFARIESLGLAIDGANSLVNARADDLYKISCQNGLEYDYQTAMYLAGFPIILDVSKDLTLPNKIINNSEGVTMNLNIKFRNIAMTTTKETFRAVVLAEFDGVFRYLGADSNQFVSSNIATAMTNVSGSEIKKAAYSPELSREVFVGGAQQTGGFFGAILRGISKVIPIARTVGSIANTIGNVGSAITGGKADTTAGKADVTGGAAIRRSRFM